MSVIGNPLLLSPEGYQISRSVRLRSSASAYFNRTPASAGNRKTWTWSGWVKRGTINAGANMLLFSAAGTTFDNAIHLTGGGTNDVLRLQLDGNNAGIVPTAGVLRDPSAWYHIIVAVDTTQATSANRVRIYINGSEVSYGSATYPTQNYDTMFNSTNAHNIGRSATSSNQHFDGYLTEINFIDGQALTPSSFGETDAVTGVWKPKKYAGTYGTNGFFLNFSDPASTTTIGYDYSGNGNNWTPNNISVTAGVTYDSMIDVPTPYADGGNGRGNYAVMNPLDVSPTEGSGRAVFSNGNLTLVGGNQFARGWQIPSSSQWYWEVALLDAYSDGTNWFGSHGITSGVYANFTGVNCTTDSTYGGIYVDGTRTQTLTTWTTNDVIGFAYDAATRSMSIYRNGTQVGTTVTANATDKHIYSYLNGTADTSSVAYNFGQRPFAYTPPTGFKALNTQNLPEPTIVDGGEYFNPVLYTGNATARSITGVGFQPDFVWTKSRSGAESHRLYDSVRGATKSLYSNLTNAEATEAQSLTAFDSDGFSLGTGAPNTNAVTYVAWNWKANGAGVSNTDGSITSTVSAGVTQGFSVVTYTGTGSNATVGHGLGVAPAMVIVKNRDVGTQSWAVYHKDLGNTKAVYLNATQAPDIWSALWNNTSPTSTVFSVGSGAQVTNGNTNKMVAYCFAEVPGFSKAFTYTGNGSADGPFVFLGFRPAFIMVKRTDAVVNWNIFDNRRSGFNCDNDSLQPNSSNSENEGSTNLFCDLLSNGFKPRNTYSDGNASGGTYVGFAFAENPFKYSLAR